jgi:hypothetical protein
MIKTALKHVSVSDRLSAALARWIVVGSLLSTIDLAEALEFTAVVDNTGRVAWR